MDKPNYNLNEIPVGQIFQISPEGIDPVQVEYGGEFLIGTQYEDWGVQGYLCSLIERPNLVRYKGYAFLRVDWKYLEFVGSVFWLRQDKNPISLEEPSNPSS